MTHLFFIESPRLAMTEVEVHRACRRARRAAIRRIERRIGSFCDARRFDPNVAGLGTLEPPAHFFARRTTCGLPAARPALERWARRGTRVKDELLLRSADQASCALHPLQRVALMAIVSRHWGHS